VHFRGIQIGGVEQAREDSLADVDDVDGKPRELAQRASAVAEDVELVLVQLVGR
jgi:hypothetical protein